MTWENIQYVNYVHKGLTIWIEVTKGKLQTTADKIDAKVCHGQTAESHVDTSKGKLTNTKLLAPSLT